MKIRNKLILPNIILMFAIGFIVIFTYVNFNNKAMHLENAVRGLKEYSILSLRLNEVQNAKSADILSYRFAPKNALLESISHADATIEDILPRLNTILVSGYARKLAAKLQTTRAGLLRIQVELISAVHTGNEPTIALVFERWKLKSELMQAIARDLTSLNVAELERTNAEIKSVRTLFGFLVALFGTGAVVFIGLAAVYYNRTIARSIVALTSVVREVAQGQFGVRVGAALTSINDEVGGLAKAFNSMAEDLKAEHDRVQEEIANRLRAETEVRQLNVELERRVQARTAALQATDKELEQFVYVASHDLKAPLRGVDNLASWIAADLAGILEEETRENLTLLQGRVHRMELLLDDLLRYSRIGRKAMKLETVQTGELIANVADLLSLPEGFVVEIAEAMPVLETERVPLEQVFQNIINNAVKHHDQAQGRIVVSGQSHGEYCEFSVSDDGPGIPPEFHERVFTMFQTLRPRDQVEGSGMGLALVKKEVESHGGAIRIESTPEPRGASFHFTWRDGAHPGERI